MDYICERFFQTQEMCYIIMKTNKEQPPFVAKIYSGADNIIG